MIRETERQRLEAETDRERTKTSQGTCVSVIQTIISVVHKPRQTDRQTETERERGQR